MFNLVMCTTDWTSGRASIPLNRMFEYTNTEIAEQFRHEGTPRWDLLRTLPCLFCEEGESNETAHLGYINHTQIVGQEVHLEISIDTEIPPFQNSLMYRNRIALGMLGHFAFSRNHWAVKDLDLYRFLLRNINLRRRSRPAVFQISEIENIDPLLTSAMMPFSAEFNAVYASISTAAANAGLRCSRADDIWENPTIIQDVVALIDRSSVIVCDCTGRNPNVFYEAGIAHTLGREVILITQNPHDIPFDLRHLRYIHYLNNDEGRLQLEEALQARMQTLIGH